IEEEYKSMHHNSVAYPFAPYFSLPTSEQQYSDLTHSTDHLQYDHLPYPKQSSRQEDGHTHAHYGATTCEAEHTHLHPGVTSPPMSIENGHIHKIYGHTSFDDEHIHSYEAYTSPAIPLPGGFHTHYVSIQTTEKDGHVHIIKGFTAPSKS